MNHVTVLKIMIDGTPSFTYTTFCYPARFTVFGGKEPYVYIEGHGDHKSDTIKITGDLFIINGNGDLITSALYSDLTGKTVDGKEVVYGLSKVTEGQNKSDTAHKYTNRGEKLYAHQIMEGWGEASAAQLSNLISFLILTHGNQLDCIVGVLDHNDENNLMHAVVYAPDENDCVKQVIGIVKEDTGAVIGSLTTKVLQELNVGVDGQYFGHYNDLKLYRLIAQDDVSFVVISLPNHVE